jgi:DNA-binding transcriptional MocR family regulator
MLPDFMIPRPLRSRPAGAALWAPRLDRDSPLPLSRQLATSLRQAIAEGRFGAGARLPSTRILAIELGVARSTLVTVFEQSHDRAAGVDPKPTLCTRHENANRATVSHREVAVSRASIA